ncbi:hypothetical protein HBB16_17580 [Pseudonocardia sp. MCCB 268]|nr:hypothetical protein [Pseudonocardia cytotoxica]
MYNRRMFPARRRHRHGVRPDHHVRAGGELVPDLRGDWSLRRSRRTTSPRRTHGRYVRQRVDPSTTPAGRSRHSCVGRSRVAGRGGLMPEPVGPSSCAVLAVRTNRTRPGPMFIPLTRSRDQKLQGR